MRFDENTLIEGVNTGSPASSCTSGADWILDPAPVILPAHQDANNSVSSGPN